MGCTRATPITMIRYILGMPFVRSRHSLAQGKTFMSVLQDTAYTVLQTLYKLIIDNSEMKVFIHELIITCYIAAIHTC